MLSHKSRQVAGCSKRNSALDTRHWIYFLDDALQVTYEACRIGFASKGSSRRRQELLAFLPLFLSCRYPANCSRRCNAPTTSTILSTIPFYSVSLTLDAGFRHGNTLLAYRYICPIHAPIPSPHTISDFREYRPLPMYVTKIRKPNVNF